MIGAAFAERFPTIARHLSVLRQSWSLQNEADRRHQPLIEHEFLPAALEIMEKPASPGLRYLLWILCSLFTIAIVWACIGKVDVVAVASGKIVPEGNVKLIQPIEIGSVSAIHVHNGQHVDKGQLLVELDPTLIGAEEAQALRNQLSADIIRARNSSLLAYLDGRPSTFTAPAGTPDDIVETQKQFIQTSIAQYEAERAALEQSKAEQRAQLTAAEAELSKLRETLPLVEHQLAARSALSEKGFFSKLKTMEYEQLRIEHLHNIDVQESNAARARASIANFDAQIHRLREAFGKEAVGLLSDASDKSAIAAQDLRKAGQRREFQQLKAPVNGTVQQLAITTVGGVVQPAQPLMVIVPDDAELAVDAMILNRDIGFVREGQPVRVKLEAFPFTDYGLLEGEVENISRDAIEQNQQQQSSAAGQHPSQQGLVYAVRIHLKQKTLLIAGRERPVGPGLAVQAEIKTGERRIIQYVLSPIARAADEAGRER